LLLFYKKEVLSFPIAGRKQFFFEKNQQKTFASFDARPHRRDR
jgi:hypothetical protein